MAKEGTRAEPKGVMYEELLARVDDARKAGFDLEASWLVYALLEDRTSAALRHLGVSAGSWKLGKKVSKIRARLKNDARTKPDPTLRVPFDAIGAWKKKRNTLTHNLANKPQPWTKIAADATALATSGRTIAAKVSNAVMAIKKRTR